MRKKVFIVTNNIKAVKGPTHLLKNRYDFVYSELPLDVSSKHSHFCY